MVVSLVKLDNVFMPDMIDIAFPANRIVSVRMCQKRRIHDGIDKHSRGIILVHVHLGQHGAALWLDLHGRQAEF